MMLNIAYLSSHSQTLTSPPCLHLKLSSGSHYQVYSQGNALRKRRCAPVYRTWAFRSSFRFYHYLTSSYSERGGFTHITFSTRIKLGSEITCSELKSLVQRAMVRCRHLAPAMACVLKPLPPTHEFQFEYRVPSSLDDALKWAEEVVVIYEDEKSFDDAHEEMTNTVWWKTSDERFTHELHIHPIPSSQSWTFT